jgi:1,2-diacylglycerol 3-alpha-glucosyltransferase
VFSVKRRVLVITELIAPYRIPVFNALALERDVDLHVIFLSRTDFSTRQWRVYEEEIRFSQEVLPCWRRRVGKFNLLFNRGLSRALNEVMPEVVVCGGYNYIASWQALHWAKRHGVPFLLWSESTSNDRRGMSAPIEILKKKFVENCTRFVVPGTAAHDYLTKLGIPDDRIFVAPNAVDLALFRASEAGVEAMQAETRARLVLPPRYFLFVGRLVRAKGVLDLLKAYERLTPTVREEVGLVFAGDGPMRAELESRARDLYPGSVHFAGFVHRDDLPAYYTLADCLVLPTHSDTWGLVVNEAMACGLPIICSRVAGCAADLMHENGWLVSPGNLDELAAAMEEAASNELLRGEMAAKSREIVRTYSPEMCAAGIARASSGIEAHV